MKLGVLDLGSNSFHLLVARVDGDEIVPLDKHKKMVRLGAGTLRHGRLDADAMTRGLAAIAELGVDIEVLSGDEEGRLIYRGASTGESGRRAVVDIGGGSVELVAGDGAEPRIVHSLPLGVLRLRESLVPADGYVGDR